MVPSRVVDVPEFHIWNSLLKFSIFRDSCLDGFCRGSSFAAKCQSCPFPPQSSLGHITFLSSNVKKKGMEKCCPFQKSSEELSNSHASVLRVPFCCFGFELSVHRSD